MRAGCPQTNPDASSNLRCKHFLPTRGVSCGNRGPMTIEAMDFTKTLALFVATALAEIVGCYLPYLWLKEGRTAWLLAPLQSAWQSLLGC